MPENNVPVAEAAIRDAFEVGKAAWNRGDIDTYLDGFWPSEKTRWVSGGTVIEGREAIVSAYTARFASAENMGTLQLTRLDIDMLTETDALAFGKLLHTLNDVTRELVFTVHLRKAGEGWLIVSDHTSANA